MKLTLLAIITVNVLWFHAYARLDMLWGFTGDMPIATNLGFNSPRLQATAFKFKL